MVSPRPALHHHAQFGRHADVSCRAADIEPDVFGEGWQLRNRLFHALHQWYVCSWSSAQEADHTIVEGSELFVRADDALACIASVAVTAQRREQPIETGAEAADAVSLLVKIRRYDSHGQSKCFKARETLITHSKFGLKHRNTVVG